ncbi:MAG: hypothetical protein PHE50_07840 [Dehalococcoidales bacterium]|nr:hypothetical protein [Dehalococcoidales bacterium]
MGESQKKILEMLAAGKISVEEATRLLAAVNAADNKAGRRTERGDTMRARYLYVKVDPKPGCEAPENPRVNVRVPVALIRAGVKFSSLIPPQTADEIDKNLKDKGVTFDIRNIKSEDIEPLIDALSDAEINVDSKYTTIHVYAE